MPDWPANQSAKAATGTSFSSPQRNLEEKEKFFVK
jgi:hypothetical protein